MHKVRRIVSDLGADILVASLLAYSALLLCEAFKAGFVNYFFNLDIIALIVFVVGAVAVLAAKAPAGGKAEGAGPDGADEDATVAVDAFVADGTGGTGEITGGPGKAAGD